MLNYLLKINKINQNHCDSSDYNRFFCLCEEYIKREGYKNDDIKSILFPFYTSTQNMFIKDKLIRLLAYYDVSLTIDFKNDELLDSYLFFLSFGHRFMSYKNNIINLLYKPCWLKNLYLILKNKEFEENIEIFLDSKANINDKLKLMININYFRRIDEYLVYLGSKESFTCFLAYELIYLYKRNNDLLLKNLTVDDPNNFLYYSFDFLDEKEDILFYITKNNLSKLKEILKKYLADVDDLEITDKIKKLKPYKEILCESESCYEEEDFIFLFDGSSVKDMCDCIE